MKLLYLEDDTSFARRFHGELLSYRAVQWNLLHCRFLSEAMERLSEDSYDAVLCDITNGDRSAPSLIARLVHVAEGSLVAYGDTSDPQLVLCCVELGACDYLDKYTLNGPQVMLRIRMAVERRARYCRQTSLAARPGHNTGRRGGARDMCRSRCGNRRFVLARVSRPVAGDRR